jgi:hypothetical protein
LGVAESVDPATVEALYAELPERFIDARNDLSTSLKSGGDPKGAKEVSELRKPSVAAWAVNRIARDRAPDVDALIRLGRDLSDAQRDVGAEGGMDRLREAGAERRRLVDRLVRDAANALQDAGMSAARATLDRVANTLMAIATDEEAAEHVRRGVLDKELPAPSGFGDDALDASLLASVTQLPRAPSGSGKAGTGRTPAQERKEREAARRAERLEAEAQALEREAAGLEREAKELEAGYASANRAAAAARRRADVARRRADDASPRR